MRQNITTLIECLRYSAENYYNQPWDFATWSLLLEAADALEELAEKRQEGTGKVRHESNLSQT